MQGIIKVHKTSSKAHLNGFTFSIEEIVQGRISLNIDGATTDFSYKEIIIVEFQHTFRKAQIRSRVSDGGIKDVTNLTLYANVHGINVNQIQ